MSRVYIVTGGRRVGVSPGLFAPYVNPRARCAALAEIARRKQRGRLIPAKMLRTAGVSPPPDVYKEVRPGFFKWSPYPLPCRADKFFELWLSQTPAAPSLSYVIARAPCSP